MICSTAENSDVYINIYALFVNYKRFFTSDDPLLEIQMTIKIFLNEICLLLFGDAWNKTCDTRCTEVEKYYGSNSTLGNS